MNLEIVIKSCNTRRDFFVISTLATGAHSHLPRDKRRMTPARSKLSNHSY